LVTDGDPAIQVFPLGAQSIVSGNLLELLLQFLAVVVLWAVLIRLVSTAYAVTMERFDHTDVWKEKTRVNLESRDRRRL
jgi:hypothetical protein